MRDIIKRFVVYSLPRCGSTTLARALNLYRDINCILEPFTARNPRKSYHLSNMTNCALHEALQDIWKTHNGIKHVWSPEGFPFEENPALNQLILGLPDTRFIQLDRRNKLRRLISEEISRQSNVWSWFNDDDKKALQHFPFQPVNIDTLRDRLQNYLLEARKSTALMKQKSNAYTIYYEDLFGNDIPIPQRLMALDNLVESKLGFSLTLKKTRDDMIALLDPWNTQLNSPATYRLLPNTSQIESELGSDEHGWLFRD
jgi:hypothetical protein